MLGVSKQSVHQSRERQQRFDMELNDLVAQVDKLVFFRSFNKKAFISTKNMIYLFNVGTIFAILRKTLNFASYNIELKNMLIRLFTLNNSIGIGLIQLITYQIGC